MHERELDVLLLGATGFTGGLLADELAKDNDLRWALAGRNADKLAAVRDRLAAEWPHCAELPLVVVDAADEPGLRRAAARARVLVTTVGPFLRYGKLVAAACAAEGTDYVDITGEAPFVSHLIEAHHEQAVATGARMVPCCGLDSIPHDLGVWFTVQQLPRQAPIRLREYTRGKGVPSGGTWATLLEGMGPQARESAAGLRPPTEGRRAFSDKAGMHRPDAGGWAIPVPTIDPLLVKRSAQTLGYGPAFTFGFYVHFMSKRTLLGVGLLLAAVSPLAQFAWSRQWLENRWPSGSGPTEEQMAEGWLACTFVAEEGDQRVVTTVEGDSDPGYSLTAKMLAAAVLTLVRDRDALPDRLGVLTPAEAMAEPLMRRLQASDILRFEVRSGASS